MIGQQEIAGASCLQKDGLIVLTRSKKKKGAKEAESGNEDESEGGERKRAKAGRRGLDFRIELVLSKRWGNADGSGL